MNKVDLKVPIKIDYLSNWSEFDSLLPQGKVILNKEICGCGCTEYYLQSSQPIILVSPRKELINCKMGYNRQIPLFYFDRSKKTKSVQDTIKDLQDYLYNPFHRPDFYPKVMVTYDSLNTVMSAIENMGRLDKFIIVVDEFTCLFTDVRLKGSVEINLLHRLNRLQNHVVYISATPLSDIYLNELDEFRDMPYVSLKWDKSKYESVNIHRRKMSSTRNAIEDIINDYFNKQYFQVKKINGQDICSLEGVFFLNSVKDIIAIIKKFNLTPNDTKVICSDDIKNIDELKKVGFKIGHVSGKMNYQKNNKTFTFVTRASFEGTDFYSDSSTTYIFADSNRDNLSLDISIELEQIIGRCRTLSNPFRTDIIYYYKTSNGAELSIESAKEKITERLNETNCQLQAVQTVSNKSILMKLRKFQEMNRYKNDYLDIIVNQDGTLNAVFNKLAYVADLRAVEIKSMQYQSTFSVLSSLNAQGYNTIDINSTGNDVISSFYNEFMKDGLFVRRMRLYCDFIDMYPEVRPEIEAISEIPIAIKNYYDVLGTNRIKALGGCEANLKREINVIQSVYSITNELKNELKYDEFYPNSSLKEIIQNVYDKFGIVKCAKASDIMKYLPNSQEKKITYKNGQRVNGYKVK